MTTTKKPQTERVCECGHSERSHVSDVKSGEGGRTEDVCVQNCPCPAFTPKKEKARP